MRDRIYELRHDVLSNPHSQKSKTFEIETDEWIDFLDYGIEYDWFDFDDFNWLKHLVPDDPNTNMENILRDRLLRREKLEKYENVENSENISFDFSQPMKSKLFLLTER